MGNKEGLQGLSKSFKKLFTQKPSQDLIDALRRMKDKENTILQNPTAVTQNSEI